MNWCVLWPARSPMSTPSDRSTLRVMKRWGWAWAYTLIILCGFLLWQDYKRCSGSPAFHSLQLHHTTFNPQWLIRLLDAVNGGLLQVCLNEDRMLSTQILVQLLIACVLSSSRIQSVFLLMYRSIAGASWRRKELLNEGSSPVLKPL